MSRTVSFWAFAAILVVFLFAAAAPSPLYVVYQAEFGFSSTTLTVIFAVYAFTLLGSLMTVGSLSDHVGRRPVIAGALVVEVVAMVVFAAANDTGWLFLARALQGAATGAAMATIGAGLIDLQPEDRPRHGALVNGVVSTGGLAAGALGSGLLVEFGPAPETLVFVLLAALFAVALVGLALLPETVVRRSGALASLRPAAGVPPAVRAVFAIALPALIATWALGGLYLSLGPSLAAGVLGLHSHLTGGLVVTTLCTGGALATVLTRDRDAREMMSGGGVTLAVGVLATLLLLNAGSTAGFFAGTAIAGLGFGATFLGAFRTLAELATPTERAGLLTVIYSISYLAFSVPAVAAGLAASSTGLEDVADVYGAVVILLSLGAVAGLALVTRREAAVAS